GSTPTRIHSGSTTIDGVPGIRLNTTPTTTSTSGAATPSFVENLATRTIVTRAIAPPQAKSTAIFCQVILQADGPVRREVDGRVRRTSRRTDVPDPCPA